MSPGANDRTSQDFPSRDFLSQDFLSQDFLSDAAEVRQASSSPPWFVLVGPTAVGKSSVAEALATRLNTDIIVADSRQVYQGMNIGTGKPDQISRKRVSRHLIDLTLPNHFFSAGAYKKEAEAVIAKMEKSGKTILIEGGTGLYIKTILYGLWEGPPADWPYREKLSQREQHEGEGTLHRALAAIDPISSGKIHTRDLPKIIRALEVNHLTGRLLSEIHSQDALAKVRDEMPHFIVGLRREKEDLYQRIEARVEKYIAEGLVEEVEGLLASGLSPKLPAMCGLGYRQMIPYITGEQSIEEAISVLKRDTRRYAKRQMTWFRADRNIQWLDLHRNEGADEIMDRIIRLKKNNIML